MQKFVFSVLKVDIAILQSTYTHLQKKRESFTSSFLVLSIDILVSFKFDKYII